ncbi:hypothetical protein A3K63_03835 [Candidatus Micrarchaeota archaeon RBG_16_49_10]|nr:MAG: hypothetical protein A3K63_03835 [Candidatus Micrarchaeota archaeon RBG_16_49_10]
MKGQSSELLNIAILVISTVIVILLTHFLFTKTGVSLRQNLVTESRYEEVIDLTTTFYNAKIAGTRRSLAQLTGDRIVLEIPDVPYGKVGGTIDVDQQLTDFFSTYFGERWALVYDGDKYESFEVGYKIPTLGNKVTYIVLVPLPNIGKQIAELSLYAW